MDQECKVISVLVFGLLLHCRLGLSSLVPGSLTMGVMVCSCLMGWHAWYVSLVPVCLGVFEGSWLLRDAR